MSSWVPTRRFPENIFRVHRASFPKETPHLGLEGAALVVFSSSPRLLWLLCLLRRDSLVWSEVDLGPSLFILAGYRAMTRGLAKLSCQWPTGFMERRYWGNLFLHLPPTPLVLWPNVSQKNVHGLQNLWRHFHAYSSHRLFFTSRMICVFLSQSIGPVVSLNFEFILGFKRY